MVSWHVLSHMCNYIGEKISWIRGRILLRYQGRTQPLTSEFEKAWSAHNQQLKEKGSFESGRELILDDFRRIELLMTASQFLARFSDLIENLFLGCKEAMSDEVHRDFVDLVVSQTQSVIHGEYYSSEGTNGNFCKEIPLFLNKEDSLKNRITQMVFLMVMRTCEQSGPEERAKWECTIRLQLSSDKTLVVERRPRRCCRQENRWKLPPNLSVFDFS